MSRLGRDDGFTLVELLVAMGLLAMAGVLVAEGFGMDRRSLHRVQAHAGGVEQVAAAQDMIRDRLEHLFAGDVFDSQGPKVQFAGSPDGVDFLSADARRADQRPIQRLALVRSNGGDLLLQDLAPSDDPPTVERTSVLLRGVRALGVDYYGAVSPGAQPGWRPDWTQSNMTPQLVRVKIAFAEGDRRTWPELIVHPAAEIDTACVLDVSTLTCRGRS